MQKQRISGGMASLAAGLATALAGAACGSSWPAAASDVTAVAAAATAEATLAAGTEMLSALFEHFGGTASVSASGDSAVIRTTDVPDHPSPYFGAGHPSYEAPQTGMVVNPNRIAEQDYVFRIPANPQVAARGTETSLDAIGVAVNGVVMFNQYAGRSASGFLPLDDEVRTFDQYNGHPAQRGNYHYHFEPVYLTRDPAALVGVLLDGFPVYGPSDATGGVPSDLDECNGHTTATPDFPDGIYHYHVTAAFPYISGCYRGTPGSVTN